MIKYIFCDLDGTLSPDNKSISETNADAVKEALQKGLGFSIATGRVYPAAKMFHDRLGLISPIICLNGALVMDPVENRVLFSQPLDRSCLHHMIDILHREDLYFHLYSYNKIYGERLEKALAYYHEYNEIHPSEYCVEVNHVEDIKAIVDSDIEILKLGFYTEDSDYYKSLIEEMAIEGIDTFRSNENLQDFVAKGIDKVKGVEFVMKLYSLEKENVMCIGDNENDVAMILSAGMGVAMKNADDTLKSVADLVLGEDEENAVAFAIKAYALKTSVL